MEFRKIEQIQVSELIPYEKNAKLHDERQIQNVAESIKRYGFVQPVVVDKNNVIVIGHCRVLAAKLLELESVPCMRIEDLTDEEINALRIIDNKTNESDWDEELLTQELATLDLTGFDLDFNISEPERTIIEDEVPDIAEGEEPLVKIGEVWTLGKHRLMCGDSTNENDVFVLMGGEKADLMLTDPPYNVALGMGGSVDEARKRHRRTDGLVIMNDKMEESEFYEFLLKCFTAGAKALKDGGSFYIWHADNEGLNFRSALKESGLTLRQTLIWNKNTITLGRQDYQWKHEPCLYGWKDGASHKWYNDRSQSTVLDFKKPIKSLEHPTMKPVELFAYQIRNSTKAGDTVLDLFGGSGTTIIASEQLDRKCYMMELDPKYCDVIIKRWEALTGDKAIKER